jgi:hypothetical protein
LSQSARQVFYSHSLPNRPRAEVGYKEGIHMNKVT